MSNMLKLLGVAASAANSHSRGGLARATLGMRFANQLRSSTTSSTPAHHSPPFFSPPRRGVHVSVYDKNADDEVVQPKAVPEEVTQAKSEEEYWEPDPQTGVFGPASELNEETTGLHSSSANATEDSVLEQKAFFRPLEDLEKPPPPL